MSDTPQSRYRTDLQSSGFVVDAAQAAAVDKLQALHTALITRHAGAKTIAGRLRQFCLQSRPPLTGLYLWGGVGRGKTYLMDLFFESLPFETKMRTHFHRFMRRVHHEMQQLKGQKDPLEVVAKTLSDEAEVICFDEFFVVDITDAMILANLLEALFRRGVVLVATSNIAPEGLYENGLQRVRFLPAIALLRENTEVLNVDSGTDYRLRALEQANLYHLQSASDVQQQLRRCFHELTPEGVEHENYASEIEIEGRVIPAVLIAEDVAWFTFEQLCDGPRSQNDYIELAREFHALIVEAVPQFNADIDDQARRFIYLVDEFYDRNVKLILSAAASPEQLYQSGSLAFEFRRTVSRLLEMQSTEYLARPHRA